jgi:glycosyltransferase involved in cell wall biosynthesis
MSATAFAVSVIVVVRNGAAYLAEALASITAQTLPPREILVVDGQSTDDTVAIAQRVPGVRVLAQPDLGLANARNFGIQAARSPWIAFLDHDDRWHPEKLARHAAAHAAHPAAQYSMCGLRFFREAGGVLPTHGHAAADAARHARTPGALVAAADLFAQIGGFDPRFAIACDAAWFTLARDLCIPSVTVPDVLLFKRLHATNLSRRGARNRQELFQVARESILRRKHGRGDERDGR